ncbi:MAG: carbohydrate ABC transporter permease [Chloroflexi bacterium]|nr:MAG: carbohydrate ABC transporter permease [Chloroflexota bacterium]
MGGLAVHLHHDAGGAADHPGRAVRRGGDRRGPRPARVPARDAAADPGDAGVGPGPVHDQPLQQLHAAVRHVRLQPARAGGRAAAEHLRQLVHHVQLRARRRDVRGGAVHHADARRDLPARGPRRGERLDGHRDEAAHGGPLPAGARIRRVRAAADRLHGAGLAARRGDRRRRGGAAPAALADVRRDVADGGPGGAGYVVARFRFRFRNAFRVSLLATHTVPGVLLLLPLFVVYVIVQQALSVRIVGSYFGVVLTYMTFALPFSIWMLSVYVASLPGEIEEQALVDGATRFEVLRHVTFPLAVPGMVVTFVFSFLLAWNDVLFASVLTSPATRTVSVGLQSYLAENQLPLWNQLMAASIVSAVPAVVLFMVVQRWIVAGLASGSLKG